MSKNDENLIFPKCSNNVQTQNLLRNGAFHLVAFLCKLPNVTKRNVTKLENFFFFWVNTSTTKATIVILLKTFF